MRMWTLMFSFLIPSAKSLTDCKLDKSNCLVSMVPPSLASSLRASSALLGVRQARMMWAPAKNEGQVTFVKIFRTYFSDFKSHKILCFFVIVKLKNKYNGKPIFEINKFNLIKYVILHFKYYLFEAGLWLFLCRCRCCLPWWSQSGQRVFSKRCRFPRPNIFLRRSQWPSLVSNWWNKIQTRRLARVRLEKTEI